MIPKRIISIWLGGEMPQLVKECIKTHKIPGYKHMMITNDNHYECKYVNECIDNKQWVKAVDYLRMRYLDVWGGIYLDSDTKVLKPFDDLLHNEMFVCEERNRFISNGIVGSIPGHLVLKEYLKRVEKEFKGNDKFIFEAGMELFTKVIKETELGKRVTIYPPEWFLPYDHQAGKITMTNDTHTYHYYLKSWLK